MSRNQTWSEFYQISTYKMSQGEIAFLEMILFVALCEKLIMTYQKENRRYLYLLRSTSKKECKMIETHVVRFIINDIVSSEEYTLDGIAYYTNTPEDALHDLASGKNPSPSLSLCRKVIELHRTIKPELYKNLMNQITREKSEDA